MTVKLASLKANLEREAAGDWIEYPDWPGVAFCVKSLHSPSYVTARDLMLQRQARKNKARAPPADVIAVEAGKIYSQHILLGWRGLDVEYSADVRCRFLPIRPIARSWPRSSGAPSKLRRRTSSLSRKHKKLRSAFRWRLTQEGQSDWLQRLADENPEEAEFIGVPELPDDAEVEPWHGLYFRAWEALRFDRFYGCSRRRNRDQLRSYQSVCRRPRHIRRRLRRLSAFRAGPRCRVAPAPRIEGQKSGGRLLGDGFFDGDGFSARERHDQTKDQ